jgi:hypothetical protein
MNKAKKWPMILAGILLVILLISNKQLTSSLAGGMHYQNGHLTPGNIEVPGQGVLPWNARSAYADTICNLWARLPISDNMLEGKGNAPRILLAKLLTKRDISEANRVLLRHIPWGVSGSSWALNKKGDYDFTITIFTTILWFFGNNPEILYPETKEYLLNILLTEDGNSFRYTAPRTLGLVKETENHILMTEGSRYLKNRWIMLSGNRDSKFDNIHNGMENKLLTFLEGMKTNGLYEFNSLPYIGYTITALLNLEAFASENVRTEARHVLDYVNWCYALGSYQLKHYPPMRRRYEKAGIQELTTDYHSVFMKSWLSYSPSIKWYSDSNLSSPHALMGVCMPYRPADKVIGMIFDKGDGYFVKLGHGSGASPEIYSAGKNFLLSAGGVNRGASSMIIPRPITLFLNDTAVNLSETFHLSGPGTDFMNWNNTGVYKNFACTAGLVFVPKSVKPVRKDENWSIYATKDSLHIAVYSAIEFGLIAVFENSDPEKLLTQLMQVNPDADKLKACFQFPGGPKLTYNVLSPKDKWVIISENDSLLNRDFDKWPLIEGNLKY